jgi:hypothetical protein
MKSAPAKKAVTAKSKPTSSPTLTIDFPQEGEKVQEGAYAVRISAPEDSVVEISINSGDWLACRFAAGYWWYDWTPLVATRCKISARAQIGDGKWKESTPTICLVTDHSHPLNLGLTHN